MIRTGLGTVRASNFVLEVMPYLNGRGTGLELGPWLFWHPIALQRDQVVVSYFIFYDDF